MSLKKDTKALVMAVNEDIMDMCLCAKSREPMFDARKADRSGVLGGRQRDCSDSDGMGPPRICCIAKSSYRE